MSSRYYVVGSSTAYSNTLSTSFDGVNESCDNLALSLNGEVQGSISVWFKTSNAAATNKAIVSMPNDSAGGSLGFDVITTSMTAVRIRLRTSITGVVSVTSAPVGGYADGDWHLIVASYDGSFLRFYYDNGFVGSIAATGTILNASNDIFIGRFSVFSNLFTGNIEEPNIYDTGLDASEVSELWNAGSPVLNMVNFSAIANRVEGWRMGDGDTYPTILGANANDLTMRNMTSGNFVLDVP